MRSKKSDKIGTYVILNMENNNKMCNEGVIDFDFIALE